MKRTLIYAMSIAAAVLFAACDGKNTDEEIEISVTPPSVSGISGAGGEHSVTITAPIGWEISIPENITWVSVSQNSGEAEKSETVTFTIEPNPEDKARSAVATVTAGIATFPITISQNAGTTEPSDEVRLYGPLFSNVLSMYLYFTPFEDVEAHALVLVDEDGEPVEMISNECGLTEDNVNFFWLAVDKMSTYTFQYWGFDYKDGEFTDFFERIENEQKSNTHSVRFIMPTQKPTLTAVDNEDGWSKDLVVGNIQKGVSSYMLYKDNVLQEASYMPVNIDEETGETYCMQNVMESGSYYVRAVLSYNYAVENPVFGPPSDPVTVTVTQPE